MTSLEISPADVFMFRAFIGLGCIYYAVKIIDTFRWWNGSDENGNPK